MEKVTIRDVAQLAGVSISSVSRYLRDPGSINPIAAVAIGDAIKRLNYTPNPFAQNLKRDSSNVIAILIPDLSHVFFAKACRALETLFYQNNYLVMIGDTGEDCEKESFYVESMLKNRVAGMIIAPCGGNTDYMKKIISENRNVMLFDRMIEDAAFNYVCEDNLDAGRQLTQHMIEKGHRDFVIIAGDRRSINTKLRLEGIFQACAAAGITLKEQYIFKDTNDFSAVHRVREIFAQLDADPNAPKCVITCNPKLTDAAVIAASKQMLQVPERFELCGFSIDDPKEIYSIPVCAMRQDPYLVGMKAGEMMLKMIKNKTKSRTPKQVLLPMKYCE